MRGERTGGGGAVNGGSGDKGDRLALRKPEGNGQGGRMEGRGGGRGRGRRPRREGRGGGGGGAGGAACMMKGEEEGKRAGNHGTGARVDEVGNKRGY